MTNLLSYLERGKTQKTEKLLSDLSDVSYLLGRPAAGSSQQKQNIKEELLETFKLNFF
jgi:hypothetical protein